MSEAAAAMDRMYRGQRHIYDATRKFYLLGRDRLITKLAPAPGQSVLEIGCGTGRNLILAARRYPDARFFGIDVSEEMLATARAHIARAGLQDRIRLAQGDATSFDPLTLFGESGFGRVFFSYTLSMIPPWQSAIEHALTLLNESGELHIVDFGDQARLPRAFRALLRKWLTLFHVTPRDELDGVLEKLATANAVRLQAVPLYGGYAQSAVLQA